MTRDLFILPVFDRWLLYAPLHGLSALINGAAVESLKNGCASGESGSIAELCTALKTDPPLVPRPNKGPLHPQFLGLIPTRTCNLDCVYCGFRGPGTTGKRMEYDLAIAAVDFMAEYAKEAGRDTLDVHFFGGEPFVAGDVVDVAVHRARALASRKGLIPRFEVATNGVFDQNRARFVGDYFDTVVLSFDGPREIHDRHRPVRPGVGSFETVVRTANCLSESPTELCFRICVTQDTVMRLEEITSWFCEEFQPSVINFETLVSTSESATAGLESPDPYQFAVHYLGAARVAEEHGVKPVLLRGPYRSSAAQFLPRWE